MFGFVQLVPQLIINYKLQSVAHMPMKAMMYRTLSTVVDDFFAFCIQMPWLHRYVLGLVASGKELMADWRVSGTTSSSSFCCANDGSTESITAVSTGMAKSTKAWLSLSERRVQRERSRGRLKRPSRVEK